MTSLKTQFNLFLKTDSCLDMTCFGNQKIRENFRLLYSSLVHKAQHAIPVWNPVGLRFAQHQPTQ